MKAPLHFALALPLALALSSFSDAASAAAPNGEIQTMLTGFYRCELPGNALGPAGQRQAEQDFRIVNGSSYQADGRVGSYLLTDNVLVMTSGPRKGQRFRKITPGFLRKLGPSGAEDALRCVRGAAPHH
ncbi:MAG: hypothetical protein WCY11_06505 [Novosphingobium sp.]